MRVEQKRKKVKNGEVKVQNANRERKISIANKKKSEIEALLPVANTMATTMENINNRLAATAQEKKIGFPSLWNRQNWRKKEIPK